MHHKGKGFGVRNLSAFLFCLILIGCTGLEGLYKYSDARSTKPLGPVPTAQISDNTLPAVTIENKACGIDGSFGFCDNAAGDLPSQSSTRIHIIMTSCRDLSVEWAYYSADGCEASDLLYTRTLTFNVPSFADQGDGIKKVPAGVLHVVEQFTTAGWAVSGHDDYILCTGKKDSFNAGAVITSGTTDCADDINNPTITNFTLMKQTAEGLYLGEPCDNPMGFCDDYPTALEVDGYANWN